MRRYRIKDLQPPWQTVNFLSDSRAFFDGMLQAINGAQQRIDMNFYIMRLDTVGTQFIDALSQAAARGVQVKIVIDGAGSFEDASRIARALSAAGVDIRVYHPLPMTWWLFKWSLKKGSFWQKLVFFSLNANKRNHHKLCVIDNHELWTGSINLTATHLPKSMGGEGWRDCGVQIIDDEIGEVVERIDSNWFKADQSANLRGIRRLWINFSTRQRRFKRGIIARSIRRAEHRIWITAAYFAPPQRIARALVYAAKQGVDVRLILPSKSDGPVFPLLSRSYYKPLLAAGVKLYEYQPAILHAKLLMIDDACLIGSTNLNHRSLIHDLEIDTLLTQPHVITQIETTMLEDISNAKHIDTLPAYSWYYRLAMFVIRRFRYWF